MDYFLRASDYSKLIQSDKLDIVISEDESIKLDAELAALEEVKSYLRHRYKEELVFAPLQSYDDNSLYYWGDRIYLTAAAFNPVTTYVTGDKVLQAGSVYQSTAGSAAHSFNIAEWTLLGSEGHYQMEVELWDDETAYVADELVKYETKTVRKYYKSLTSNTNVNPYNDNGDNWEETVGITGENPTTAYWTAGDSRNKLVVMHLIDIVLYHLHSRINPRNIPEFRIQRRDDAISYLKMIARGQVSIDLDLITPEQGNNISYGSQPVNNNFY